MHLAALLVASSLASPASLSAAASFWHLARRRSTSGVAADNLRALTEIKGARDVSPGARRRS